MRILRSLAIDYSQRLSEGKRCINQLQRSATTPTTATSSQVENTEPSDSRAGVSAFSPPNPAFDEEINGKEREISLDSISI